jgi:hypothetical protein
MPNHVENKIVIENSTEEVLTEVKRIFKPYNDAFDTQTEYLVNRVFGMDAPEEYNMKWYCDNTGAKWMYGSIEDESDTELTITITSAWNPINGWVKRFAKNLRKIKDDIIVHNTFEDDEYNFAGVFFLSKYYDDLCLVNMNRYGYEIWDDSDVRNEYYGELHQILMNHRMAYHSVLADVGKNPNDYV